MFAAITCTNFYRLGKGLEIEIQRKSLVNQISSINHRIIESDLLSISTQSLHASLSKKGSKGVNHLLSSIKILNSPRALVSKVSGLSSHNHSLTHNSIQEKLIGRDLRIGTPRAGQGCGNRAAQRTLENRQVFNLTGQTRVPKHLRHFSIRVPKAKKGRSLRQSRFGFHPIRNPDSIEGPKFHSKKPTGKNKGAFLLRKETPKRTSLWVILNGPIFRERPPRVPILKGLLHFTFRDSPTSLLHQGEGKHSRFSTNGKGTGTTRKDSFSSPPNFPTARTFPPQLFLSQGSPNKRVYSGRVPLNSNRPFSGKHFPTPEGKGPSFPRGNFLSYTKQAGSNFPGNNGVAPRRGDTG